MIIHSYAIGLVLRGFTKGKNKRYFDTYMLVLFNNNSLRDLYIEVGGVCMELQRIGT